MLQIPISIFCEIQLQQRLHHSQADSAVALTVRSSYPVGVGASVNSRADCQACHLAVVAPT